MGAEAKQEIDIAIARLKLGYSQDRLKAEGIIFKDEKTLEPVEMHRGEHILTMPPRRFKTLTDTQIDSLVEYLKAEQGEAALERTRAKIKHRS